MVLIPTYGDHKSNYGVALTIEGLNILKSYINNHYIFINTLRKIQ